MRDSSLPLRRAVLTWLKNDAGVTALVPAERIYPQVVKPVPDFPFIRWGGAFGGALDASCVDGAELEFTVHAFVKDRADDDGVVLETAEDFALRVRAQIVRLGRRHLTLEADYPARARIRCTQVRFGSTVDPHAFHAIAEFTARVVS